MHFFVYQELKHNARGSDVTNDKRTHFALFIPKGILNTLVSNMNISSTVLCQAHIVAKSKYTHEIKEMTLKSSGWHFSILQWGAKLFKCFALLHCGHHISTNMQPNNTKQSVMWRWTSNLPVKGCIMWSGWLHVEIWCLQSGDGIWTVLHLLNSAPEPAQN